MNNTSDNNVNISNNMNNTSDNNVNNTNTFNNMNNTSNNNVNISNNMNNNSVNNTNTSINVSNAINNVNTSNNMNNSSVNNTNTSNNESNAINNVNTSNDMVGNINTNVINPSVVNENVFDPTKVATNVVNTEKVKEPSNAIIFFFVILILFSVFFIDDIVNVFINDNYEYFNGSNINNKNNLTSNNLVNGFIEFGSENSFMKLEDVKFYNFKQGSEGEVYFNYVSDKSIKNIKEKEIYIVLYDGSGKVIFKKLFDDNIVKDTVKQYVFDVDMNVYFDVKYAKVVIFNETEKNTKSSLTCTFVKLDGEVTLQDEIIYNFINDNLKNYTVTKRIKSSVNQGSIYDKYNKELLNEKDMIKSFNINVKDDINYLNYSVDLNNSNGSYVPLYNIDTLLYTINYKESLKGWKCK